MKRQENIDIYKEQGIIIFLDRPPEDIVTDVDVSKRPLLKDGPQKYLTSIKSAFIFIMLPQTTVLPTTRVLPLCWRI